MSPFKRFRLRVMGRPVKFRQRGRGLMVARFQTKRRITRLTGRLNLAAIIGGLNSI